jgi:hypothetical protein
VLEDNVDPATEELGMTGGVKLRIPAVEVDRAGEEGAGVD